MFSQVGRGPAGDSYKVAIDSDSETSTYLAGYTFHSTLREWTKDWVSENINGGKLDYAITIHEDSTFDLTFTYTRDDRFEWEFTTPKIPYRSDDEDILVSYEALAKILSTSEATLHWLDENKESDPGDELIDTGIRGTQNSLLDYIDERDDYIISKINDPTDRIDSLEDQLKKYWDTLQEQIGTLQEQVNTLQEQVNTLQEQVDTLQEQINGGN